MPAAIDLLLSAKRVPNRKDFHRRVFDSLMFGGWRHEELTLNASTRNTLLDVLSRWVIEAPVSDDLGVLRLLSGKKGVRALIQAAGADFGAFVQRVLDVSDHDLKNPQKLPDWKQAKLAALGDVSHVSSDMLALWHGASPPYAVLAAVAALDTCSLDEGLAARAVGIGKWLMSVGPVDLPVQFLGHFHESAFSVSYLADPDRHEIKRAIVRQAVHLIRRCQPDPPVRGVHAGRLRLTIVGELLFPRHAMFRCYAEALEGLKRHFDVTLLTDAPTRCPQHSQFSDKQVYFPAHERDVGRLAEMVRSTQPDIVLYPSVGMCYWTFALSLLRLAPLQLMAVGHPAPSCSDVMDGTLLHGALTDGALHEYGCLLPYTSQALPVIPAVVDRSTQSSSQAARRIVAINAAFMKLNPAFLAALEELLSRVESGVDLHFFPNVAGCELSALRHDLERRFPTAVVHPIKPYGEYMGQLSMADLLLQSFPFGGTNTTIDALALGIPMICLRGRDLSARVDPVLLQRAGLSELCTSSPREYVDLAVHLLNNPDDMLRMREKARGAIERLSKAQDALPVSMAEAVLEGWQRHEVSC